MNIQGGPVAVDFDARKVSRRLSSVGIWEVTSQGLQGPCLSDEGVITGEHARSVQVCPSLHRHMSSEI